MSTLIDLFPTSHRNQEFALERVCDHIDANPTEEFSVGSLCNAIDGRGWRVSANAARTVIQSYLALGLIQRVSGGPGPRPVLYRVRRHAMPKQVAA